MLCDDAFRLVGGHFYIGRLLVTIEHFHDGLILADTNAAGLLHADLAAQALFVDLLNEGVEDGTGAGSNSAGGHSDYDADSPLFFAESHFRLGLFPDGGELLQTFHNINPPSDHGIVLRDIHESTQGYPVH